MLGRHGRAFTSACAAASLAVAACGSPQATSPAPASGGAAAPTTPPAAAAQAAAPANPNATVIRYALWDSGQQPAYEQCAAKFQGLNPNIQIKFEQVGWDDYWSSLQTGFVSGNAPDVFTDHLAKYPEFAAKGQIVDIQPLVEKDKVDTKAYIGQLPDLWVREGKRYGLPKDWDTVAVVYNKDMFTKAGVDPAIMKTWTWNPKDGGTFQQTLAKLSLDKNGNNGESPNFDKNNVTQYGYIHQGAGGGVGQTQWSMFAASDGFKFIDNVWGTKYYYDDPKLAESVQWYADLANKKGFAPPLADVTSLGGLQVFASGKGALTIDGSWTIGDYTTKSTFPVGFGLLPTGPSGRKSMFNGLADSIWTGSKHQDEAWKWVSFAASQACEDIVGSTGVVFPAIKSGADKSLAAHQAKGADVSPYTDEALDPNGTFLFPITDHASEITAIMTPTMEGIMLGQTDAASALKDANSKVNALFK
jgi:multiple sugar transport system substrate-binding protein